MRVLELILLCQATFDDICTLVCRCINALYLAVRTVIHRTPTKDIKSLYNREARKFQSLACNRGFLNDSVVNDLPCTSSVRHEQTRILRQAVNSDPASPPTAVASFLLPEGSDRYWYLVHRTVTIQPNRDYSERRSY